MKEKDRDKDRKLINKVIAEFSRLGSNLDNQVQES
jgi:hypothetical protein